MEALSGALRAQQSGEPKYGGQQQEHLQQQQPQQQTDQVALSITHISGSSNEIAYRIDHRDSNTLLFANILGGASIKVKPGAMVAMKGSIQIHREKMSFKKRLMGEDQNESIFSGFGEVLIAPDIWGDVAPIHIDIQTTWWIGTDAFLACTSEVMPKHKNRARRNGSFLGAEVTGPGILFVQSLGGIIRRTLQPGEEWIVSCAHLVAWAASYKIERVKGGGIIPRTSTNEILACRFTGPGIVYIQTRNPVNVVDWISCNLGSKGRHSSSTTVFPSSNSAQNQNPFNSSPFP